MIHGTSTNFLSSILEEGVTNQPKQRVWSEDKGSAGNTETLPGASYWTNNLLTALSAARNATQKFGGNAMLVFARVDTGDKTVELDEDHFPSIERAVSADLKAVLNGYMLSVSRKEEDYDRSGAISQLIERLHKTVPHIPKERFEKEKPTLLNLVNAWIEYKYLEENQHWPHKHHINHEITKEDIDKARKEYRDKFAESLKKLHFLATAKDDFIHNVRFTDKMRHSGRHKILMIAEFLDTEDKQYSRRIEIKQKNSNDAVDFMIERLKKQIGPYMLVTYKGKALYDDKKPVDSPEKS